jgi:hypothetical protein
MSTATRAGALRAPPTRSNGAARSRAGAATTRARARTKDGDDDDDDDARTTRAPRVNAVGSSARLKSVEKTRCFRLGVFADAQYGDKVDETREDDATRTKRFRASERRLRECIRAFEDEAATLSGIVNLGDLFDGYNEDDKTTKPVLRTPMRAATLEKNGTDLAVVADLVNTSKVRMFHCVGNHDCNVGKEVFLSAVNAEAAYYSASMPRGWRLIVLDTTDLNPRYVSRDAPEFDAAMRFAQDAVDEGREDVVPWGGGIGPVQFDWLRDELNDAAAKRERVIVASHNALHRDAARYQMSAWNSDEVSDLIESSGCVKICLAGHDHPGHYHYRNDVHYVTLEAMLEAAEGETSFAFLDVYEHDAVLTGVGVASSRRMRVSPPGVFTGIATFGAAEIGAIAGSGSDARVETSSMGLVDWINAYGRD